MTRRAVTTMLAFAAAFAASIVFAPRVHVQAARSDQKSLAIIVNRANPIDDLSTPELRAIFLGQRSHWANGRRITLVMMEPGQPERETLLRQVCRLSESEFRRRFLQGLLTGEVLVSPKTLATPVGVRKFVFNVPGAIGYVKPEDADDSVKIISINGHLPGDSEYSLKLPVDTK